MDGSSENCRLYEEVERGFANTPRTEPMEIKPKRDIVIKEVLNGFIVIVGCQTVVFGKKYDLFTELSRYLDDRASVEREYMEKDKKNV